MGELTTRTVIGYPIDSGVPNSGTQLPDVTADDNGDVLTVVDGAWDKAEPSGGGFFLINLIDHPEEYKYETDKTAGEILTAYEAGKTCILKSETETSETYNNLLRVEIYTSDDSISYGFYFGLNASYSAYSLDDYLGYTYD